MADTTTAGRHRTELALRKLTELDYEATGQLPAKCRHGNGMANNGKSMARAAGKGLGWLMGLPMKQAAKERQRKAERQAQPSQPRRSWLNDDWDVAVIIRSSRRSRAMDWFATIGLVLVVLLFVAAAGGS